jgi:hypothetical protein
MVTLADLRARNTLPSWHESVAIVQELVLATVGERGSAVRLPDIRHIGINPDGTIALLPHSSIPQNPVRHLAVLLCLLLENVPAPEPLLDLAERNLNDPPEFAGADDLTRALRYFERPGREDDIKDLAARAEGAREQKSAEEELRHLEARARELLEARKIPERHILERDGTVTVTRWEPRPRLPAISTTEMLPDPEEAAPGRPFDWHGTIRLVVALSILAFAVYWFMRPEATPELTRVKDRVAGAASKVLAVGDTDGSTAESGPSAGSGRSSGRASAPGPRAPSPGSGSTGGASSPGPASSSGSAGSGPAGSGGTGTSGSAATPGSSPAADQEPAGQDGGATYSGRDADVTPPVPLSREAAAPPAGAPSATYDVVVNPSGAVEQIRKISGDSGMRESMMRAHIKSWKFRPATRGGQPVRYRMQVRVAV